MSFPFKNYRRHSSLNKQRGAAIIVALFVVALVAAAAALMIERLRTDIRRTELILNANSAYLYAQGSVAWAMDQLNNNWKQQQTNKIIDKTPIKSPVDEQDGFTISSIIYDAQAAFNLNNLTDAQYQTNFTRLLTLVQPDIDPTNAQNITQAIIDWISPAAKNPLLDEYYLKLTPGYRAAHRPMASVSELRLVKDITPELYAKLAPFITALPTPTMINVNNAEAPVLMSLSMTLTPDAAKALVAACQKSPFVSVQAFREFDIVKNNPIDGDKITVTSNYFLLRTDVTLGQQTLTLYTLLERVAQSNNQAKTNILWQSMGTL
ncbi:MAG: type II secretion system minor pseudopilin GspK [Gammaproteobacteria bacterium]